MTAAFEGMLEGHEGDRDAVFAAADLVGRAGATAFDIGFELGNPANWHAQAFYQGVRVFVGGQPTPAAAATGLSVRLLTGAACRCGQKVSLRAATSGCLWRLEGQRWVPGCDAPSIDIDESMRGDVAAMRRALNERSAERAARERQAS